MNILNWNVRGIDAPRKRQILEDLISKHHIDLIAIQETKKENFNHRIMRSISIKFDK